MTEKKVNTKYCTDVDTDPHSKYQSNAVERKRDQLFFLMIDNYREAKSKAPHREM